MLVFWSNPNACIETVDFTFSQSIRGVKSRSIIDHFISSTDVFNSVTAAGVVHSAENIAE